MSEEEVARVRPSRRRRRANATGGRRTFHKVGVTPEEELALRVMADRLGITVPRLMVEAALTVDRDLSLTERQQVSAELFRVSRLLGSVANNVNQMARATNATGELHEDLHATLTYVRTVLGPRVERVLLELVEP